MGVIQVLGMLIERMDIVDLAGILGSVALFRVLFVSRK